jgi:hypothetical protein
MVSGRWRVTTVSAAEAVRTAPRNIELIPQFDII